MLGSLVPRLWGRGLSLPFSIWELTISSSACYIPKADVIQVRIRSVAVLRFRV